VLIEYIVLIPILLMSLTIHEVSHGFVAYLLGDDTAKRAGRLNLNPIAHIDPIGLLMFIIVKIGWAKPVPINPYNFKNYKRDTALCAAAGPASNFVIAIIFALLLNLYTNNFQELIINGSLLYKFLGKIISLTIVYNFALGLFNLIPFPPLDGSKIVGGFLSDELYYKYTAQEKKGMFIFLAVIILSNLFNLKIIGKIIMTPLSFLLDLFVDTRWLYLLLNS